MESAEVLRGKVAVLLAIALAVISAPTARASTDPNGDLIPLQGAQDTPTVLLVQTAADNSTSVGNSGLTPQAAAEALQEAMRRGEAVSLASEFGYISLDAPLQVDGERFTTTAIYSLLVVETENSDGQELGIPPDLGDSQASPSAATDLEAEQRGWTGSSSETLAADQPPPTPDNPKADDLAVSVLTLTLEASLDKIINTAGFLGAAIANGASLEHAEAGASMAISGVDYGLTADFIASLPGIVIIDPDNSEYANLNVDLLVAAILLNNQIINESSDATVSALAENPYFLEINEELRDLRSEF